MGLLLRLIAGISYLFLLKTPVAAHIAERSNNPFEDTLRLNDSLNTISIENFQDHPVIFSLNINEEFPLRQNTILQDIRSIAQKNHISEPLSAWMYVTEHTFHSRSLTPENWVHSPEIFLNSVGGGMCDDRASVLAGLWKMLGYPARIINLEGHVVPEVFYENTWQMFDPDLRMFYCNENGRVLSVNELEKHPEIINAPSDTCGSAWKNPAYTFPNAMTSRFMNVYTSVENNRDESAWHLPVQEYDPLIILPAFSVLKITFDVSNRISNFIVELNKKSSGYLRIPLVPLRIEGEVALAFRDQFFQVTPAGFVFPDSSRIDTLNIREVLSESNIYYAVNSKLSPFSNGDPVYISSYSQLRIRYEITPFHSVKFAEPELFFDTIRKFHPDFYRHISPPQPDEDIEYYLRREYTSFLKRDYTLSKREQRKLASQFNITIRSFIGEGARKEKIKKLFQEKYPLNIYYIFMACRYEKTSYLEELLRLTA